MKNLKLIFQFLTLLLLSSCKEYGKELINTQWEVKYIIETANSAPINIQPGHILQFSDKKTCSLRLDANHCSGEYVVGDHEISFPFMGCTEMCCDSVVSLKIADVIRKTNKYQIKDSTLVLTGIGIIQLKRK